MRKSPEILGAFGTEKNRLSGGILKILGGVPRGRLETTGGAQVGAFAPPPALGEGAWATLGSTPTLSKKI